MNALPSVSRLVRVAAVTAAVCLVVAGALWVVLERCSAHEGGIGTKVLPASYNGSRPTRAMPDSLFSDKPLAGLLPEGWENSEKSIVIEKSRRFLSLYSGKTRVKTYFTALGGHPIGPKTRLNDLKTPEGVYHVCRKNPHSGYGLGLFISYPGEKDAKIGLTKGIINKPIYDKVCDAVRSKGIPPQDTKLGGNVAIHGGGIGAISNDLRRALITDWTFGCPALRTSDIREVYDFAEVGTKIVIHP